MRGASGSDPQTFPYIKSRLMVPVDFILDTVRAGRRSGRQAEPRRRAVREVAKVQERREFPGRLQDLLQKKRLLRLCRWVEAR